MVSTIAGCGHEFVGVSKLLDVEAYREVVGLNNHGVALLQSADYSSVTRLFKQASQKMMSAMHDESSNSTSPSPEATFAGASTPNHTRVRPYKWDDKSKPESCTMSAMETVPF